MVGERIQVSSVNCKFNDKLFLLPDIGCHLFREGFVEDKIPVSDKLILVIKSPAYN